MTWHDHPLILPLSLLLRPPHNLTLPTHTRCIVSLGRPSGCGMPGTVAAAPLAKLLSAAADHMLQRCLRLQPQLKQHQQAPAWCFVDLGAGAGRMLLAAKLLQGAARPHSCAGIELCDLTHTFEACKARMVKRGLLQPAEAHSCRLQVGDAMHLSTTSHLLGPEAAAAAGPVMASLIDEGMPLSVREHLYSCVAQDPRVQVVLTVHYKSRAGHLPAVLTQAGFELVQEMPAPLMGGKCSTAGRIFVRTQQQQQCRLQRQPAQQQQRQAPQQQQPGAPTGTRPGNSSRVGCQQQAAAHAPRCQRSAARRAAAAWKGW